MKANKRYEVSTGNTLVTYDSNGSGEFTLYACRGTKWEIGFICAGGKEGRDLGTRLRNREVACMLSERAKK